MTSSSTPDPARPHARRASETGAADPKLLYLVAVIELAGDPIAHRTAAEIAAVWQLCERAARMDATSGLPFVVLAAIAAEFYRNRGQRPPAEPEALLQEAARRPLDRAEYSRLSDVLRVATPRFAARLCVLRRQLSTFA